MGLFDFGGSSVDFSGINKIYDESSQKILALIDAAQKQGRTDIADSLKKALDINQPYMKAGNTAMSEWMNSLGIGDQGAKGQQNLMDKFQQSPGYQYALQQSNLATQRKAAATGQGMSGAEQRELGAQSQGLANQDWTNWLNNYQTNLSTIAGRGQQSAMQQAGFETQGGTNLANMGMQYANMSSQEMMAAAKAKAEAEMAQQEADAQSKSGMLGGLGQLAGGVGGFIFGGPGGAMIGSSALGSLMGGKQSGGNNWLSSLFGGGGGLGGSGSGGSQGRSWFSKLFG